jgi:hypothetical protein
MVNTITIFRVPAGTNPVWLRARRPVVSLRSAAVTPPTVIVWPRSCPLAFWKVAVRTALSSWPSKPPKYPDSAASTAPESSADAYAETSIVWVRLDSSS